MSDQDYDPTEEQRYEYERDVHEAFVAMSRVCPWVAEAGIETFAASIEASNEHFHKMKKIVGKCEELIELLQPEKINGTKH